MEILRRIVRTFAIFMCCLLSIVVTVYLTLFQFKYFFPTLVILALVTWFYFTIDSNRGK